MYASRTSRLVSMVVMIMLTLVAVIPFYFMLMMTTYTTEQLFTGIKWLPGANLVNNMQSLLRSNFLRYFFNSFYIAVCSSLLSVLSSALCGYSIAKLNWKLKKALLNFVLITMMIPSQVGIVAYVVLLKNIGWTNTHYPLIFPAMANSFGVFWMSQFIKSSIPGEIIESARIDGANEYRIFFAIVSPLLIPAFLTLLLMNFVGSWNSFFTPLIILNRSELYTVPLGIFELKNLYKNDLAAQITGLSLSLVPLTLIFVCTAKYFVAGVMSGSVKG